MYLNPELSAAVNNWSREALRSKSQDEHYHVSRSRGRAGKLGVSLVAHSLAHQKTGAKMKPMPSQSGPRHPSKSFNGLKYVRSLLGSRLIAPGRQKGRIWEWLAPCTANGGDVATV